MEDQQKKEVLVLDYLTKYRRGEISTELNAHVSEMNWDILKRFIEYHRVRQTFIDETRTKDKK
jgi:hypothetical protein